METGHQPQGERVQIINHLPAGLRPGNDLPPIVQKIIIIIAHGLCQRLPERGYLTVGKPGERNQELVQARALGRLAKDMEAVPDLSVRHLVQILMQLFQEFIEIRERFFLFNLQVMVQLCLADLLPDHLLLCGQFGLVLGGGLVVIGEHHLQLRHLIISIGIVHDRNQMVDDAAVAPPLGLSPLARIVDDVGIDVGQIGYGDIRET